MRHWIATGLLISFLFVASCASQPPPESMYGAPGFWFGLVHGMTAPLALIGGLFSDIRIYAFPNTGWWYDLGFILGISAWGGGVAVA